MVKHKVIVNPNRDKTKVKLTVAESLTLLKNIKLNHENLVKRIMQNVR